MRVHIFSNLDNLPKYKQLSMDLKVFRNVAIIGLKILPFYVVYQVGKTIKNFETTFPIRCIIFILVFLVYAMIDIMILPLILLKTNTLLKSEYLKYEIYDPNADVIDNNIFNIAT